MSLSLSWDNRYTLSSLKYQQNITFCKNRSNLLNKKRYCFEQILPNLRIFRPLNDDLCFHSHKEISRNDSLIHLKLALDKVLSKQKIMIRRWHGRRRFSSRGRNQGNKYARVAYAWLKHRKWQAVCIPRRTFFHALKKVKDFFYTPKIRVKCAFSSVSPAVMLHSERNFCAVSGNHAWCYRDIIDATRIIFSESRNITVPAAFLAAQFKLAAEGKEIYR